MRTPLLRLELGPDHPDIRLKLENLQPINAFSGRIRYTRVFVRRDGRWQAITMQHTPMP